MPSVQVLVALDVRHIVDDDDTVSAAVESPAERLELLLAGRVPYLEL